MFHLLDFGCTQGKFVIGASALARITTYSEFEFSQTSLHWGLLILHDYKGQVLSSTWSHTKKQRVVEHFLCDPTQRSED